MLSSQVIGDLTAAAAAHGVSDTQTYGVGDPSSITVGLATFTGQNDGNAAGLLAQNSYGIAGAFYTHQPFNGTDNSVTVTFSSPVKAFAFEGNVFNVTIDGAPGSVPMTLTTNAGDVLNTFSTPYYWGGVDLGTAPLVFNGLISHTAFTS